MKIVFNILGLAPLVWCPCSYFQPTSRIVLRSSHVLALNPLVLAGPVFLVAVRNFFFEVHINIVEAVLFKTILGVMGSMIVL